MLNKDDKKFIADLVTGQISGLDNKINGLEQKLTAKIDGVEQKLTAKIDGLDKKIDGVDSRLSTEIRHNGVLIEKMQGDIDFLVEGHQTLNGRLTRIETDVTEIKETIFDYPILRETVKEHSRLLAAK